MKRTLLLLVSALLFASHVEASAGNRGALDANSGEFYFTGLDIFRWSGNTLKKYSDASHIIYKFDFDKKDISAFYNSSCPIDKMTISWNKENIGYICDRTESLHILNRKAEEIVALKGHIHEYIWHPDSSKIMYMTGKLVGRGYGYDVESDGIWLYDMKRKTTRKVANRGSGLRIDVSDNSLYFWDGSRTVKMNLATDGSQLTDLKKDVEYSPDYHYYIYFSGEDFEAPYWSPFRIYDTRRALDLSSEQIGFVSERNPTHFIWAANSRVIAFSGRTTRMDVKRRLYIYDIEASQVLASLDGVIAGYNEQRSLLVVYIGGKFTLVKY